MIAYHFPPMAGSSGFQRTLGFAKHLLDLGWKPVVLTVHPRAYVARNDKHVGTLPAGIIVERAFALDTARHLSFFRKYPAALARPDRFISWWLGAVPAGLRLIRQHRPTVIWSTYPIATAHLIGATLHRISGLPWVADFRDPMTQDNYPADPRTWKVFDRIESWTLRSATACVFVTPGALSIYRARYSDLPASRFHLIENGYDDDAFQRAEQTIDADAKLNRGRLTLLHSGIVYPHERDPTQLMVALGRLHAAGRISPNSLNIRFRAPVHGTRLLELARRHGVEDFVQVMPPVSYHEALREMLHADALLLLQAATCNQQVPVKLYEYVPRDAPSWV
jgi:glycosyltransferase involved in cell wall biosynthesis